MREKIKESALIGGLSFLVPFIGVALFAYYLSGWSVRQSEIAGIALSTTSLAVVYAVLVETGLTAYLAAILRRLATGEAVTAVLP